jgi:hypothetical protein
MTPTVFIDCQALSTRAELFFEEILKQLQTELRAHGIKGILAKLSTVDVESFRAETTSALISEKVSGSNCAMTNSRCSG